MAMLATAGLKADFRFFWLDPPSGRSNPFDPLSRPQPQPTPHPRITPTATPTATLGPTPDVAATQTAVAVAGAELTSVAAQETAVALLGDVGYLPPAQQTQVVAAATQTGVAWQTAIAGILATQTRSVQDWQATLTAVVPGATQTAVVLQATQTGQALSTLVAGAQATQTAVAGAAVQTSSQGVAQTMEAAVPSSTLTALASLNPTDADTAVAQIQATQTALMGQALATAQAQVLATETAQLPLATLTAVATQLTVTETPPDVGALSTAVYNAAQTALPPWLDLAAAETPTPSPTP
jgi:hypothetical protein